MGVLAVSGLTITPNELVLDPAHKNKDVGQLDAID